MDADYDIGPGCYNFCRIRDFGAPVLGPLIIVRSRNLAILGSTVNITNVTTSNNIVFNGGPGYRFLSKHVAHPVPTLQLVRQTDAAEPVPPRRRPRAAGASPGATNCSCPRP